MSSGSVFNAIGHACEAFFALMPGIGGLINASLIVFGCIAFVYWLSYLAKDPEDEKNYLSK
jgi:hypothetical protein